MCDLKNRTSRVTFYRVSAKGGSPGFVRGMQTQGWGSKSEAVDIFADGPECLNGAKDSYFAVR